MSESKPADLKDDAEFAAILVVYGALKDLSPATQTNVLEYVCRRLGVKPVTVKIDAPGRSFSPRELAAELNDTGIPVEETETDESDGDFAGVSSVALKWIRRNGLAAGQLSKVFSLGLDEIDLVTNTVPGKSNKEKMRNVLLLSGAAAYLGAGAARVDDKAAREALGHYNAYDATNFATYMKELAAEISGSKASGYTLTSRGLAAAAEVIKAIAPTA